MPRIENMGTEVTKWCEETGNGSTTWDLCRRCFKKVAGKPVSATKLTCDNGDPEGTVGSHDTCTPDYYSEMGYDCDLCREPLTNADHDDAL